MLVFDLVVSVQLYLLIAEKGNVCTQNWRARLIPTFVGFPFRSIKYFELDSRSISDLLNQGMA